jgi:phage repressor protein C with HTH and peptisase S24 domain
LHIWRKNMQIDTQAFEDRLKEAIKPEALKHWCERFGVNHSTLNGAFQRKTIPKIEMLVQISAALGKSLEWVLGLTSEDASTGSADHAPADDDWAEYVRVPLYDVRASAGHGAFIDHEKVGKHLVFRRDFLNNELQISRNGLYCIRVKGVSMEPVLRDGHPVLIDPNDTDVLSEGPHLLRLEGALLLKNLQRLPGGRLRIWSENKSTNAYQPIELDWPPREGVDLQILGRVRWTDSVF